jgi:hypothetical protein
VPLRSRGNIIRITRTPGPLPADRSSLVETRTYDERYNLPAGEQVDDKRKFEFLLPHEDAGMMMAVLNGPNAEERRVAVGTAVGQGSSVLVQDGDGNTVGRVQAMPRGSWNGGVATATAQSAAAPTAESSSATG